MRPSAGTARWHRSQARRHRLDWARLAHCRGSLRLECPSAASSLEGAEPRADPALNMSTTVPLPRRLALSSDVRRRMPLSGNLAGQRRQTPSAPREPCRRGGGESGAAAPIPPTRTGCGGPIPLPPGRIDASRYGVALRFSRPFAGWPRWICYGGWKSSGRPPACRRRPGRLGRHMPGQNRFGPKVGNLYRWESSVVAGAGLSRGGGWCQYGRRRRPTGPPSGPSHDGRCLCHQGDWITMSRGRRRRRRVGCWHNSVR